MTCDETKEIIELYLNGRSMRSIASMFNTNHKLISKTLKANGIATRKAKRLGGGKKFTCDKTRNYNNMCNHLRFDVCLEWLMKFEDFDKLKLLNEVITNRSGRWDVSTEWYIKYLERFYFDKQFNDVYNKWVASNFDRYKKPSIDHVIAKAKGGDNSIDNLQFLTWFENRCKNDMSQEDWDRLKLNIQDYFI